MSPSQEIHSTDTMDVKEEPMLEPSPDVKARVEARNEALKCHKRELELEQEEEKYPTEKLKVNVTMNPNRYVSIATLLTLTTEHRGRWHRPRYK
jgi:hypothetical protein